MVSGTLFCKKTTRHTSFFVQRRRLGARLVRGAGQRLKPGLQFRGLDMPIGKASNSFSKTRYMAACILRVVSRRWCIASPALATCNALFVRVSFPYWPTMVLVQPQEICTICTRKVEVDQVPARSSLDVRFVSKVQETTGQVNKTRPRLAEWHVTRVEK